uniref:CBM21 domain-containing protein n=1 Tax=Meloidogyne incognita TaxID=6306 RepID=A0A914N404_MELIC
MEMSPRSTQLINYRPLIEPFKHDLNSPTITTNSIPIAQGGRNNNNQQQNNLFHSFSTPLTSGFLEHFCALHLIPSSINSFVDKNDCNRNNNGSRNFVRSKSDSAALDLVVEKLRPKYIPFTSPFASVDSICSLLTKNETTKQFIQPSVDVAPSLNEEDDEEYDFILPPPQTSRRKLRNVRFADECGFRLSTVRIMTEPSDYPPKISPAVLRRIKRAAMQSELIDSNKAKSDGWTNSEDEEEDSGDNDYEEFDGFDEIKRIHRRSSWKLCFKQPASEYLKFRDTLDRLKVALENVMLRNDLGRMNGTIKVANIAYEKSVFVRISDDRWSTFRDRPAKYQCSPSKAFDTFRFDFDIPRNDKSDSRIEFCICYKANNTEYWDSNDGHNFVLTPDEPFPLLISSSQHFKDIKVYY